MKMRLLGKTEVKVSRLSIGTLTFGGQSIYKHVGEVARKETNVIVNIALDAGVNFFDTATSIPKDAQRSF